MNGFITQGTVASLLAVAGIMMVGLGKPALAAWFNDPNTATLIVSFITSALALYAGAAKGIKG